VFFFFFQAEDGIRDLIVTGVQTCALPISAGIAVTRLLMKAGIKDVILCDTHGILVPGREHMNSEKEAMAAITNPEWRKGTLAEEIGRASCRERGQIWVGGGSWKEKTQRK